MHIPPSLPMASCPPEFLTALKVKAKLLHIAPKVPWGPAPAASPIFSFHGHSQLPLPPWTMLTHLLLLPKFHCKFNSILGRKFCPINSTNCHDSFLFCLLSTDVLFVFTVFHFYLLACCLNYFIEQYFQSVFYGLLVP